MKRLFVVLLGAMILSGCTAARESGFYEHNAMYRDWDHLKFSLYGYKTVEPKETQLSREREWWGVSVEASQQ